MEHFTLSTQLMIFAFLHWQKSLRSQIAKDSAALAFDSIINKSLKTDTLVMLVADDAPIGSIRSSGFPNYDGMGFIQNVADLADEFAIVGEALRRKDGRIASLDEEHLDTEGLVILEISSPCNFELTMILQ